MSQVYRVLYSYIYIENSVFLVQFLNLKENFENCIQFLANLTYVFLKVV